LLAAHVVCLVLVHGLIHLSAAKPANRWLEFLRHFYPVLLYTGFYRETEELNQMFITGYLDPTFFRLEEWLFGLQPSLLFMVKLPHLWVSELLYTAYFSYYLMIAGVGLALFLRDRRQFFHYVSVVSFVFYVCYLIYIIFPVVGPRILYRTIPGYVLPADVVPAVIPETPAAIQAGPVFQLMAWIYETFEALGAAFPSSHVAIALATVWFSFRYLRGIRWVHAVMVALLCVSTVYARYHYVVDVFAGILTAAILVPVGNRLYSRFQEPTKARVVTTPDASTGLHNDRS
jgi:membrane-associated phospholipid phosphatase